MAEGGIGSRPSTIALYAFAAGTLLLLIPAVRGYAGCAPGAGDARRPTIW